MWAVLGALVANVLITILKFAAAIITGSSGMMAESLHSLADTTNQIFLLLGLRFYRRPATPKHPFGYGMERFFWSFIAALGDAFGEGRQVTTVSQRRAVKSQSSRSATNVKESSARPSSRSGSSSLPVE